MTVGSTHADTTTPAQVAKQIRADLKAAQAAGDIDPALKFSVRTDTFSGGAAVDVTVKGYTGATHRPEWLAWNANPTAGNHPGPWKTPEVDAMTAAVKKVCAARIDATYRKIYNTVCLEQTPGLVYA